MSGSGTVLRTERLELRPIRHADGGALLGLLSLEPVSEGCLWGQVHCEMERAQWRAR